MCVCVCISFLDFLNIFKMSKKEMQYRKIFIIIIFCLINLINYMDRFTVAGILNDIQVEFKMNESQSGFLQTAFILSFFVVAPLIGYLGDRMSRKYIMLYGIFFWNLSTIIGSFMPTYNLFLVFRCFVGIGEASFTTIAPTIISDIFTNETRSRVLALFYLAIPVGCGLGYIVSSKFANFFNNWRYGLRITPCVGSIAGLLFLCFFKEPLRGENEEEDEKEEEEGDEKWQFIRDLKYLFVIKSYILSTLGYVCATFVAGALAWWGSLFFKLSIQIQNSPNTSIENVDFIFGSVAVFAGIVGVITGAILSEKLRNKICSSDPIICGTGLILSTPLLSVAIYLARTNIILSFVASFFGQLFLNMNWAIVTDMLLYLVMPTKRSFAAAVQVLLAHALGDAGSPYFVGFLADALYSNHTIIETFTTTVTPFVDVYKLEKFFSIQSALYYCLIVNILGAIFFYASACFINTDYSISRDLAFRNQKCQQP